ncbi:MAG: DUF378 domain-containing protein [Deltaproteobacteria bacterium]
MRNPYDLIGRLGLLLAIAGAVNWLLVGLFEWNLVQWLFTQSGTQTVDDLGERIVYIVVGVGGVLALPMLAATLARSRSRDLSSEERGRSTAGASEDDTDFYYGAPKNERELAREPQHVRRIERVIVEEPMPETSAAASASAGGGEPRSAEESLRYGTVEETDEGFAEGYDEQRRAA